LKKPRGGSTSCKAGIRLSVQISKPNISKVSSTSLVRDLERLLQARLKKSKQTSAVISMIRLTRRLKISRMLSVRLRIHLLSLLIHLPLSLSM